MKNIPTAKEFLESKEFPGDIDYGRTDKWMIEFAKLHVQAALKAAANNVEIQYDYWDGVKEAYVSEKSILNAYPDNFII
jgi:hypothetical protein